MNNYFLSLFIISIVMLLSGITKGQHISQNQEFTMALSGDALITRKLSVYQEPEFLKMIDLIRSADLAFTNLEMLFHNYETYPMNESGGTYMRADPALLKELVWAGFDMVSRANNHQGDYGVAGMRLTSKYTAEAGLVQAGVGESLAEAREAKFLETTKGRVALISCSASFPDHSRAGKSRDDVPARPGLNPLRFTTTYHIKKAQSDSIQKLAKSLSVKILANGNKEFQTFGQHFAIGDSTFAETIANETDMKEISSIVKNASGLADYTIISCHAHDTANIVSVPPELLVTFARAMIDAGADIYVGHGPHVLKGIEIYKGKPILYSLGNFIFQNETLLRLPSDNYEKYKLDEKAQVGDFNNSRYNFDKEGFPVRPKVWESVIAVPKWKGKQLVELIFYPLSLGFGEDHTVRGRPLFANNELSRKIIDDLKLLSSPFGTEIEFKNGVGIVKLPY